MESKQLAGFEIRDVLGEGGMGKVYLAHDPTLDRPVALKVIRSSTLSEEGKKRFLREARACSRINHPNIITVYAAGDDDGTPYMAMELIKGRTLREYIDEGPIEWRTSVRWMIDILEALDRLHQEGIVHRDLKPENIMITEDGVIKLMDFGLAHLQATSKLTQDGTSVGTAPYMSPEQVMGRPADQRSDLFSLATIMHEMLTGMHPFRGEHPMALMYSIRNETPKPIRLHSQDYPPNLQAVLDRAFEKELDRRYPTAQAFRDGLAELIPEISGTFHAPVGGGGATARWLLISLIGVVVVALGVVGWQIRSKRNTRVAAQQHNEIGQDYLTKNDFAAAGVEFREAIVADDTYAPAWHNLGMAMLSLGDTTEAIASFEGAGSRDAAYPSPRFMLAVIREVQGDTTGAEHLYQESIAADADFLPGYNNLAALYLETGQIKKAAGVLERGLAVAPQQDDRSVRVLLLEKRSRLADLQHDHEASARFMERARELRGAAPDTP